MSQASITPLNPATTSGSDLATKLTDAEAAELTSHAGSSRPSYAAAGTVWLDTTTTPWVYKFYDGTSDVPLFQVSASSHKLRSRAAESTVASGTTTDVLAAATDFVAISGTATITSLGSEPLQLKFVRATGAFTLTHNATTLILPTGANIVAAAGDNFIVASDTSGNARVFAYQRASGLPLTTPTADIAAGTIMSFFQAAPPTGWTQNNTHNNKAIRIVSGTGGGSGGSLDFSTVFGKTSTDSATLTQAHLPAGVTLFGSGSTDTHPGHTHGYNDRYPSGDTNRGQESAVASNDSIDDHGRTTGTGGAHAHAVSVSVSLGGSGSGHAHNMDIRVRYIDMILASKDA